MIKRWVTWGGVSRLVKLLLILIVIYYSLTILQSKRPVIPLARDLLFKGFSDRTLSNSTSDQPHPNRGAVDGGSGGPIISPSGISQSSKSGTKRAKSATKWAKSFIQMAKSGIKRTKSEGESAKYGKKLNTKRARTKSVKWPGRQSVRLWIDVPTAFPWRQ